MKQATKLIRQVRRSVQSAAYSNALYRKILAAGEGTDRLYFTLPDAWPGDAQAGLVLMSGQQSMFDRSSTVSLRHAGAVLRNLRAVGTDGARQMAVKLIESWLAYNDKWSEEEWALALLEGSGVLVQPGYFYDFESEAFLVVSLLTEPGVFAEGIRRVRAMVG